MSVRSAVKERMMGGVSCDAGEGVGGSVAGSGVDVEAVGGRVGGSGVEVEAVVGADARSVDVAGGVVVGREGVGVALVGRGFVAVAVVVARSGASVGGATAGLPAQADIKSALSKARSTVPNILCRCMADLPWRTLSKAPHL